MLIPNGTKLYWLGQNHWYFSIVKSLVFEQSTIMVLLHFWFCCYWGFLHQYRFSFDSVLTTGACMDTVLLWFWFVSTYFKHSASIFLFLLLMSLLPHLLLLLLCCYCYFITNTNFITTFLYILTKLRLFLMLFLITLSEMFSFTNKKWWFGINNWSFPSFPYEMTSCEYCLFIAMKE